MQQKIIKPTTGEVLKYGRRAFLRRIGLAAAGPFVLPNLIINPVHAGTALIVDSSGDKRIALTNAAIARAFDIGSWNKLRLGVRLMCTATASTASVTPHFIFGLQSGESDLILDASSTNFLGLRTDCPSWIFTDSTDDYMTESSTSADALRVTKRVGATWTNSGVDYLGGYSVMWHSTNGSATKNDMLLLQVTKGTPNFTIGFIHNNTGNTTTDVTRATFLAKMTDVTLTAPTSHRWTGEPAFAFSESAGTLDHVAIGWDRPEFAFQISDIAVSKIVQ